jgi:hypothetical protein
MNASLRFEEALARVGRLVPQQDPLTTIDGANAQAPDGVRWTFRLRNMDRRHLATDTDEGHA